MTLNPWAWVQAMIDKTRHPVGYIFEFDPTGLADAPDLTTPEKVAAYFGYGVWAAYGDGRVTVGADGDKYKPGATGGEETHKLIADEMPKHKHSYNDKRRYDTSSTGTGSIYGTNATVTPIYKYDTEYSGGDKPHNNMQPYIVVYRWRRVA